jgi:hypothetical protein
MGLYVNIIMRSGDDKITLTNLWQVRRLVLRTILRLLVSSLVGGWSGEEQDTTGKERTGEPVGGKPRNTA